MALNAVIVVAIVAIVAMFFRTKLAIDLRGDRMRVQVEPAEPMSEADRCVEGAGSI